MPVQEPAYAQRVPAAVEVCTAGSLGSVQVGSSRLGFVGVVADSEDPGTEIVAYSRGSLGDLVLRMRPEDGPLGNRQLASASRSEQIRVEDTDH
jgi:hypothetical protein